MFNLGKKRLKEELDVSRIIKELRMVKFLMKMQFSSEQLKILRLAPSFNLDIYKQEHNESDKLSN